MGQSSEIVPTDVGERVATFLRRLHPRGTAATVAAETGCGVDAGEKWLERASMPNGRAMLRLFLAYGPAFVLAVIDEAPAWLGEAASWERQRTLEAAIAAQAAELARMREGCP